MELLLIFGAIVGIVILLKLFVWILKAAFFVISIPFKILGGVIALVVMLLLLPFALTVGAIGLVLVPLIPFLLIGFGIHLLTRR